ncbi:hypothetical protein [uncultured Brevundimonas sp.]|uniref:hypothetical protein n=1 Tax=uncultured Brevundimonas sp. TaxID=213418 RepID=UPI0025EDA1DF|nr:hypothetical protein [uncultured Brevundimonas sp.]
MGDLDPLFAMSSGLLGGPIGRHSRVEAAGKTLKPLGALSTLRMPRSNGFLFTPPGEPKGVFWLMHDPPEARVNATISDDPEL